MSEVDEVLANQRQWCVQHTDALRGLKSLPDACVAVVVTSPPYYALRSYLKEDDPLKPLEMGSEPDPETFVRNLVAVFREVKRVLRDDGCVWLNVGDSYSSGGRTSQTEPGGDVGQPAFRNGTPTRSPVVPGLKPLDLVGIPERLMLGLQADGWYIRSRLEWIKKSPMPISVMGWRWERHRVRIATAERGERTIKAGMEGHGGNHRNVASFKDDRTESGRALSAEERAQWSPCPGCDLCSKNGGLVLRRGAWRPTSCHEPVFLLAKTDRYFCDGEAARVPNAAATLSDKRMGTDRPADYNGAATAFGEGTSASRLMARRAVGGLSGANLRDAIFTDQHHYRLRDDLSEAEAADLAAHLDALRPYLEPYCDDGMSDVLHLGPRPLKAKHYAAFPDTLVRPLLLASTSAMGACGSCGSPIVRVLDRNQNWPQGCYHDHEEDGIAYGQRQQGKGGLRGDQLAALGPQSQTLGWRPSCSCQTTETRPQLILDPFCGSGTTLVVARQLGLRAIGFDLSSDYIAIARKRIGKALRERPKGRPATPAAGPSLFDAIEE